jgi:hypothetical protein
LSSIAAILNDGVNWYPITYFINNFNPKAAISSKEI